MTYWLLNLPFLVIAGLVAVSSILAGRSPRWRAVGLAAVVVLVLTAVFDNVLVGAGIVGYDASRISGVFVGVAPLEDFSYAVAAVVLMPSLWHLLGPPPPRPRVAQNAPSESSGTMQSGQLDDGGTPT